MVKPRISVSVKIVAENLRREDVEKLRKKIRKDIRDRINTNWDTWRKRVEKSG